MPVSFVPHRLAQRSEHLLSHPLLLLELPNPTRSIHRYFTNKTLRPILKSKDFLQTPTTVAQDVFTSSIVEDFELQFETVRKVVLKVKQGMAKLRQKTCPGLQ